MTEIFSCGFMRSITLRANEDFHSSQYENKYDLFKSQFKHVEIEKKYFWRKSKDLIAHIRKKRWHGENRVSFMNLFSFEEWKNWDCRTEDTFFKPV